MERGSVPYPTNREQRDYRRIIAHYDCSATKRTSRCTTTNHACNPLLNCHHQYLSYLKTLCQSYLYPTLD